MKPEVAALTGVAATGGMVGGGFLAHSLTSKNNQEKTLESHFKSRNLTLISFLDDAKEGKQWSEEFSLDQEAIKKYNNKITTGEELKSWCWNNMKLKVEGNKELVPYVEKWCILGTVESRISRTKGKELISDSDDSGWTTIYDTNNTEDVRTKIKLTGAKGSAPNNKEADLKVIKGFCSENKAKTFLAEEKETVYNLVLKWCTKDSQGNQA
ncbi:hypothetical protein MHF_1370 [Mycoplasma haemofelis Ohio2]|uniref:Uncharacterized protein n=1 Tax=Mycoplasma haemofelis (strain Ohio2) TaxID=859194 RepID=F6FGG8_MYCHI|nr:hypothetical protein MHF_1370 [Mycoplasma haemofelis Ohio2]